MVKKSGVSELKRHVGYWMRFVSNHVSHAFLLKVEAQGVTIAEWAAMRELFDLGPTNPSLLADRMGMTRGAISKLVERLCGKELVERTYLEDDRRFQSVSLTTNGRRLVPALAKLADENDAEFFGHLSTERQTELIQLLMDIVQRQGWKEIPVT